MGNMHRPSLVRVCIIDSWNMGKLSTRLRLGVLVGAVVHDDVLWITKNDPNAFDIGGDIMGALKGGSPTGW